MPELKPRPMASTPQQRAALETKQAHRKMLALALLVVTFAAVIVKDRDFWFGADGSQDMDLAQPQAAQQTPAQPAPAAHPARPVAKKQVATAKATEPKPASPAAVATKRSALPPLDVEVITGDSHRTLSPASNATKVEIARPGSASRKSELTAKLAAPTNAAQLERVNGATHPALGSFDGSYPLLAQQMKVQGSVVLQALIGVDGIIQNLRVLSGPAILASAARQAVREWRFKPYLENGQAVETKAVITVNFTINVADGATTTASLTSSDLVISMAE